METQTLDQHDAQTDDALLAFEMDCHRRLNDLDRTRTPELYRQTRQACGLTIANLAEILGLSHDTVARRERGRSAIPAEAWMALGQIASRICPLEALPAYWTELDALSRHVHEMDY